MTPPLSANNELTETSSPELLETFNPAGIPCPTVACDTSGLDLAGDAGLTSALLLAGEAGLATSDFDFAGETGLALLGDTDFGASASTGACAAAILLDFLALTVSLSAAGSLAEDETVVAGFSAVRLRSCMLTGFSEEKALVPLIDSNDADLFGGRGVSY